MMNKQGLVIEFLREKITNVKTGIIIKGINDIEPSYIVQQLAKEKSPLYAAITGYEGVVVEDNSNYKIANSIEKAVLWRSDPTCAGCILVFIKSDTEKLHSLAEFDSVSTRDISRFLLKQPTKNDTNTPTQNFWEALGDTSDYYTFDALYEFVSAVSASKNPINAIPENMWRLGLLSDDGILGARIDPTDRLAKNRDLIFAIAQLSEDSRKKLSRSLTNTKTDEKEKLKDAYHALQNFYKYGNKETLKSLDLKVVQDLFSASRKKNNKKTDEHSNAPIRSRELDNLISQAIVSENDEDLEDLKDLNKVLSDHYRNEDSGGIISSPGGICGDRNISIESQQSDLRKLVGKFCNLSTWGGLMETDENVLKDAISADINASPFPFDPNSLDSIVSFSGGVDGNLSLFNFIKRFDAQFSEKGLDGAIRFSPIIDNLETQRRKLCDNLDMIMYHPILLFGASEEIRQTLADYINTWERLYRAFCDNEPIMRQISLGGTSFVARALLLLDVLYVKTPKEWKGILLPLHPVYLWKFYEVFNSLSSKKKTLSEEDKERLAEELPQLPQVLHFIVANSIVTHSSEDPVLPCSGNIEMLPTFENKTNRYLGDDGIDSIEEILTRWVGFAPYTRNEIRICSVDAPNLIGVIRQLKSFMDKNSCNRVVYDVYLTRGQNGNTELSKLDYAGHDYEIGEYIKNDRISIRVKNVKSAKDVKIALSSSPVHVAFYFDQSSYSIEFGPTSHDLCITPLVITYDYDFDEIQHKGSIFPSSQVDSGFMGGYHKLLKSANVINNYLTPHTMYSGSADVKDLESTIKDKETQWLVVADRDTNNYQPTNAIPIGEKQYDRRTVNIWASDQSRIITQYLTLLREYNLNPTTETLIDILSQFGHITSSGLISIPKRGADKTSIDNKKKGLLGTLFAASWYTKMHKEDDALVASLDGDKARQWLKDRKSGNERADLVGLYLDKKKNVLHVQPIEVKTRDESPDSIITRDDIDPKKYNITGHAADQVAHLIELLREIFSDDENAMDMFTSARREVLKYQIVSECFRNVHDAGWQKRWYDILKGAFTNNSKQLMTIDVSGILVHIKLNETSGGEHTLCNHPDFDDCRIDYWKLTSKEIQHEILGDNIPIVPEEGNNSSEKPNPPSNAGGNSEPSGSTSTGKSTEIKNKDTTIQTQKSENNVVGQDEINQLIKDFKTACGDYHIALRECEAANTVVGPSVIRLKFRLGRGQSLQGLSNHLEDIGREMKRTGVIVQQVPNSDELLLDVPRLKREMVLFKDVLPLLPEVTSPEQLFFPLGRTPNGKDLIEDLGQMPHMLVGGSTGSGKSVFLFTMLASILMTHPRKEDLQLILSSSKIEDFIHFEGLPHLYSGSVISDAEEATRVITDVIYKESERRGRLLAEARVANIIEYNKVATEKLAPIVIVIDEFADLADQLETKKDQGAFYKPVQRIAQAGRSRGIHLVICTQRPEAKLVPSTTKAQLNGRVALRVNDGTSSRMIIESPDAQYLQTHGDMIYKNADIIERAQGYLITIEELDQIVSEVINCNRQQT